MAAVIAMVSEQEADEAADEGYCQVWDETFDSLDSVSKVLAFGVCRAKSGKHKSGTATNRARFVAQIEEELAEREWEASPPPAWQASLPAAAAPASAAEPQQEEAAGQGKPDVAAPAEAEKEVAVAEEGEGEEAAAGATAADTAPPPAPPEV